MGFLDGGLPDPHTTARGEDKCGEEEEPWYFGQNWERWMRDLKEFVGLEDDIVDASDAYAANNDYRIYFTHIPTGKTTHFKAFLKAFDDQYSSEWNDVDVYGRMDPITTFQGTRRQINFSFDVIAGSKDQATKNHKMSYDLIRSLYPVYQTRLRDCNNAEGGYSATSLQAPPLLKIRFKNLIRGGLFETQGGPQGCSNLPLVGKLSGLSYQPNMEAGFYEDGDGIYPKINSFSCNFTVLHTGPVGWDLQPLLSESEGEEGAESGEAGDEGGDGADGTEGETDGDAGGDSEENVLC